MELDTALSDAADGSLGRRVLALAASLLERVLGAFHRLF